VAEVQPEIAKSVRIQSPPPKLPPRKTVVKTEDKARVLPKANLKPLSDEEKIDAIETFLKKTENTQDLAVQNSKNSINQLKNQIGSWWLNLIPTFILNFFWSEHELPLKAKSSASLDEIYNEAMLIDKTFANPFTFINETTAAKSPSVAIATKVMPRTSPYLERQMLLLQISNLKAQLPLVKKLNLTNLMQFLTSIEYKLKEQPKKTIGITPVRNWYDPAEIVAYNTHTLNGLFPTNCTPIKDYLNNLQRELDKCKDFDMSSQPYSDIR
jgi:hypothetical protein